MLVELGWTGQSLVRNDTIAVLRAGTDRGWGIAVVCGSGMNAAGVAADGRAVRDPALGEISGDLAAGGGWVGVMALAQAVRGEDGRGRSTALSRLVPGDFALPSASAGTEAVYPRPLPQERLGAPAPPPFAAAAP